MVQAQQVQDQRQAIGSGQESQIAAVLRQHASTWGHSVQLVTSEKSAVQLWNQWNPGKFKKQYAVLVNYNPVLKKAHVTLGSKVKGDVAGWSGQITRSFQGQQFVQGMQTLLKNLKASNALPAPQENHVSDYAGRLDAQTRKNLTNQLGSLEKQLNLEGTVVVLPALKPYTPGNIEAFALNLFNAWGVGNPQKNDGFMLLVSMQDRKIRIQMGKGYGSALNAQTSKIIQTTLVPAFKAERYQSGIEQGTLALIGLVKQHPIRPVSTQTQNPASQGQGAPVQQSPGNSEILSGWDLFLFKFQIFMDNLQDRPGGVGWMFLIPILLPLIFVIFAAIVVTAAIRSTLRRGGPGPTPGRRNSGFRHSHHHHDHPHSGHHNDDDAQRAFMAGAAASTLSSSSWDSGSSSSDSSSSSSSDSFSGGSSDSSSGSSGDW
ncbi:hypothetical protein GCM10008938_38640 [Deinococcus roseus]|uniref:TPM domain-containing protein n=2 Tax=Deinococcus roseus TaxID=392414 RepID=A0ABQ2D813_9DEIO|nr:hypothetical protein GCM10008938_38640 [Deinococcus roseus]